MAPDLIIRPARPEDRGAAERICANTWDWGDYIPEVWDEWLADEGGQLAVAELAGQIVALGRVRLLPGGQAWLEGMRVDPDYRRLGIARRFFRHKLAYARAHGARVARLGTSDQNQAVHRMMERAGMERVGRYELLSAPALADSGQGAEPIGPSLVQLAPRHAGQVRTFLRQSPVLARARGLYCLDWAWQTLSAECAADLLAAGQLAGQWGADGSLVGLAVVQQEPGEERLWVGFADAGPAVRPQGGPAVRPQGGPADGGQAGPEPEAVPEALELLARALRGQANRWGLTSTAAMLPDLPLLRDAFRAAGYGPAEWQGEIWIYEIALDPSLAAGGLAGETPQDLESPAGGTDTGPGRDLEQTSGQRDPEECGHDH